MLILVLQSPILSIRGLILPLFAHADPELVRSRSGDNDAGLFSHGLLKPGKRLARGHLPGEASVILFMID